MADIVLMFEVHQPYRLRLGFRHRLAELFVEGRIVKPGDLEQLYLNEQLNKRVFKKITDKCYLPASQLFLKLLDENEEFKVSFSFSGLLLEQAEKWTPDLLELFRQLASHRGVEVLEQTYYHSLAFLISEEEFKEQVREHREAVKTLLGVDTGAFENTEFIYNNRLARLVYEMGYSVVMTEGVDRILGWRSPNYVYKAKGLDVRVLMRNYMPVSYTHLTLPTICSV